MVKLDLDTAKKTYKEWSKIAYQYTSRIDFVIRKICELFGRELDWWDYTNCGHDGEEGNLKIDMIDSETIQLQGNVPGGDMVAIIFGSEWDFSNLEFPVEFLYYDFEEDLKNGIERYKDLQAAKAKTKKPSKTKELIESAKKKLTKEELKALKSNLKW